MFPGSDRTARAMQGRTAGFVTRLSANIIDLVIVVLGVIGAYCLIGFVRFTIHPLQGLQLPEPPPWETGLILCALAVAYLTVTWTSTGRSIGKRLAGVRLQSNSGATLGPGRSLTRAILYVVFPVGFLWVILSARNRSAWDLLLSTQVVYDWGLQPYKPEVSNGAPQAREDPATR